MQPVFRFAPSPNGELHLGHALSALIDHELCRQAGGRFLLRIEDIDRTRCRPEYEAAIYRDLAWLGLTWEEPIRRQSEHMDDYAATLARLEANRLRTRDRVAGSGTATRGSPGRNVRHDSEPSIGGRAWAYGRYRYPVPGQAEGRCGR